MAFFMARRAAALTPLFFKARSCPKLYSAGEVTWIEMHPKKFMGRCFMTKFNTSISMYSGNKWFHSRRFCTTLEALDESVLDAEILNFLESTMSSSEGPHHCWLNCMEDRRHLFYKDGGFLVLVGAFNANSKGSPRNISAIETTKLLKQRFPDLQIFGLDFCKLPCHASLLNPLQKLIIDEFVTFPVLLTNKVFKQLEHKVYFILFEGFKSPMFLYNEDLEVATVQKVIREFKAPTKGSSMPGGSWVKHNNVINEPPVSSSLKNLVLFSAGCVSVDEHGQRIFCSDTNHHRILILDPRGNILDCVGSSPGFEDGAFENAKLSRPASSVYIAAEDCLYFVDCENHAIRSACLATRVVQTFSPAAKPVSTGADIWRWIQLKLGLYVEAEKESDDLTGYSLIFPWHILKYEERFIVINRSLEVLWVLCATSGNIKELHRGFSNVLKFCQPIIVDRLHLVKEMYDKLNLSQTCNSLELSGANMISSFVKFLDHVLFCDTDGLRIMRYHRESGAISSVQLSNFGVLGLPYWFGGSLEKAFTGSYVYDLPCNSIIMHHFDINPGKLNIRIKIDMPAGAQLAAPLEDGSVWCQARGSAVELTASDRAAILTPKVGEAQEWVDELDSLIFSNPPETPSEVEEHVQDFSQTNHKTAHFSCSINTSPGNSEVIVFAVMYLKLLDTHESGEGADQARVLENFLVEEKYRKQVNPYVSDLFKSYDNLSDLVFMRPLHLRIRLNCYDDTVAGDNRTEIVSKDSVIDVKVTLV